MLTQDKQMAAEPAREGLYSPERDIARVAGPSLCSAQWASYGDWPAAKAASSEGSGEADSGAEAAQQQRAQEQRKRMQEQHQRAQEQQ